MKIKKLIIQNFKSYKERTEIDFSNLNIFMGANSSGKSSAIQALMILKQTLECHSPEIDLLLTGRYATLGDFNNVANDENEPIIIGLILSPEVNNNEDYDNNDVDFSILWKFCSGKDNEGTLDSIQFKKGQNIVEAKNNDNYYNLITERKYAININGKDSKLFISFSNLFSKKCFIAYDNEFNHLFRDFINELLKVMLAEKKIVGIQDKLVCREGLFEFFNKIINSNMTVNNINDKKKSSAVSEQTENTFNLLDKYASNQFKYYRRLCAFPVELMKSIIGSLISNRLAESNENLNQIKSIVEKYQEKFNAYKNSGKYFNNTKYDSWNVSNLYMLPNYEKNSEIDYELVSEIFRIYQTILKTLRDTIYYLGPIREKPQGLYNVEIDSVPKYVGPTGGNFASVLKYQKNKYSKFICPDNTIEELSLNDALNIWVEVLDVAQNVNVKSDNAYGISVEITDRMQHSTDIMNVGIGTSQILPVLIMGLLSEPGETLLFEQPELHLHPYSQSRLADFFIALVKNGRKLIIETHSEYLLLRLRYFVLVEKISNNDISINFFQNKKSTSVYKANLTGQGSIEYPDDFKDETQNLVDDILSATLLKNER